MFMVAGWGVSFGFSGGFSLIGSVLVELIVLSGVVNTS
jgi:hypothetical protein